MPSFGKKSLALLNTCHPDLQAVAKEAIKHIDFSITQGHRTDAEQEKMFLEGKSNATRGKSKHNLLPSEAFDWCNYPGPDFYDEKKAKLVIQAFYEAAFLLKKKIRSGILFSTIHDPFHLELL